MISMKHVKLQEFVDNLSEAEFLKIYNSIKSSSGEYMDVTLAKKASLREEVLACVNVETSGCHAFQDWKVARF